MGRVMRGHPILLVVLWGESSRELVTRFGTLNPMTMVNGETTTRLLQGGGIVIHFGIKEHEEASKYWWPPGFNNEGCTAVRIIATF